MFQYRILILLIVYSILSSSSAHLSNKDSSIEEVMSFISSQLLPEIKSRKITVYTGTNWKYLMIPSVSKYLFEELDIVENLAPLGNFNRPGDKYEKKYICVHDTGDHSYGAEKWSNIVKEGKIGNRDYEASFQYVVGNDGYYHNIPDDEIAYHAGDGHTEESAFGLIKSGVYTDSMTKEKPIIDIDKEGYYTINGEKSLILAPTKDGQILTAKYINDLGIYSELQKVEGEENKYEYYLGRTWYSPTYDYISNYGGNLNSIGIESCINVNTDVYYTWQKVAKLVANLMYDNKLDINAVVQHHYFSGKNCPQTKRTAGLWGYFKTIIESEYQMLLYKKMGYSFEFKTDSDCLDEKGRVIKNVAKETTVNYSIIVKDKDGNKIEQSFYSYLYPYDLNE